MGYRKEFYTYEKVCINCEKEFMSYSNNEGQKCKKCDMNEYFSNLKSKGAH